MGVELTIEPLHAIPVILLGMGMPLFFLLAAFLGWAEKQRGY